MYAAATARPSLDHAADLQRVRVRLWSHRAGRYDAPSGAHRELELAWVEQGSVTYRIGSREIAVDAGQALVVPGGIDHATRFDGQTIAGALAISAESAGEIAEVLGRRAVMDDPTKVTGALRIVTLGRVVRDEISAKESGYLTSVDALAEAMTVAAMRETCRAETTTPIGEPRVRAVLDLIHTSYADPIGIDDMARAAGASRFHMSRLFREAVGQSPYQYLVRTRIERAAELLRNGKRTVTEVAFTVGFSDLGRFARAFRAHLGTTPAAYGARRSRSA